MMKKAIVIHALIAGVVAMSQNSIAQPPGGGRGGFAQPAFADIDKDEDGKVTEEELAAYFEGRGAPGGAGGRDRAEGRGGRAGGPGGAFDPDTMFGLWDANEDGEITKAEFDARPRRGPGGRTPGAE